MILAIILALLFGTLTYVVLCLNSANKALRSCLAEVILTVKEYDDAAAKHYARANKAEQLLNVTLAKLKKFDRARGTDGRFIQNK